MKAVAAPLVVVAVVYLAVCAMVAWQQRALIYYPQVTTVAATTTDFALDRGDVVLRGWTANPGRTDALLYFGGNAESVQQNLGTLDRQVPGRTIYLVAYRGYGASDGEPTEAALLADGLALYDSVRQRHPRGRIGVLGRSLGSGIATHVAAERDVDRLALVTPFDSMVAVARRHYPWLPVDALLRERYDSVPRLARHRGPVLVLASGRDTVVPADHARALVAGRAPPARWVEYPAAGHDDLHLQPGYAGEIARFFG